MALNVYFAKDSFIEITEDQKLDFYQVFSGLGGQMGLWLGISVMTVLEYLQYFGGASLVKYKQYTERKNRKKGKPASHGKPYRLTCKKPTLRSFVSSGTSSEWVHSNSTSGMLPQKETRRNKTRSPTISSSGSGPIFLTAKNFFTPEEIRFMNREMRKFRALPKVQPVQEPASLKNSTSSSKIASFFNFDKSYIPRMSKSDTASTLNARVDYASLKPVFSGSSGIGTLQENTASTASSLNLDDIVDGRYMASPPRNFPEAKSQTRQRDSGLYFQTSGSYSSENETDLDEIYVKKYKKIVINKQHGLKRRTIYSKPSPPVSHKLWNDKSVNWKLDS